MLATKYLIVLWPVFTAGSGGDRWPKLLLCHCPLFFFLILPPKPSNFSLNFYLNRDCMQLCHLYHINPSIPFSHFCPPQVAQNPGVKVRTFQTSAMAWSGRSIKDILLQLAKSHDIYCICKTTLSFYPLHLRSENRTSSLPLLKLKATQQATLIV